jgi:hypothetical protein
MSISSLSDILNKNIQKKSGLAKQVQAVLICEEFEKIILDLWGDKIKNLTKALYFKDSTLTIASLSSTIAQEIKLHENKILNLLNKKFQLKTGPPGADNTIVQKINYLN